MVIIVGWLEAGVCARRRNDAGLDAGVRSIKRNGAPNWGVGGRCVHYKTYWFTRLGVVYHKTYWYTTVGVVHHAGGGDCAPR